MLEVKKDSLNIRKFDRHINMPSMRNLKFFKNFLVEEDPNFDSKIKITTYFHQYEFEVFRTFRVQSLRLTTVLELREVFMVFFSRSLPHQKITQIKYGGFE